MKSDKQEKIEDLIPVVMPKLIDGMSFNGSLHLDTDVLPRYANVEGTDTHWTMIWLSRIVARIVVEIEADKDMELLNLINTVEEK